MLRNDHNLRELVMQIFPLEKTEGSAASPGKAKDEETVAPTLTEANRHDHDFGMSRETERFHDYRDVDGNASHLNQTEIESPNLSINAINKQNELTEWEMPQIASTSEPIANSSCLNLRGQEEGETYKSFLDKTNGHVQVQRKRRTKRKPCRFLTGQKEDGSKTETAKEISKPSCSGLMRKGVALPQISKPFISTKTGDFAVSFVNKYLARKLNLKHESEVEVMCLGHPLVPTLTLNSLLDMWLEAVSNMGPVLLNCNAENGNGGNFVMQLTYRRNKKQRALQSNLDLMQP
ncbi:E3 ubiquitin protein ligase DRIP2-like protein [Corchorus capsularis]|uniref:E3 ubiquitin protein ligase DRIP2-like protein n=1 Tax=Corchorus capsularis TaxID=210143 RepID=A0A1R3HA71_COCAP|nr:E3 ubiquitin protein ligase DRIP2-like protein [Corchorus capsularis]